MLRIFSLTFLSLKSLKNFIDLINLEQKKKRIQLRNCISSSVFKLKIKPKTKIINHFKIDANDLPPAPPQYKHFFYVRSTNRHLINIHLTLNRINTQKKSTF